ncbi:S8 family peptidase [bacterium]|nr:S8 family peptidase [bacterium]
MFNYKWFSVLLFLIMTLMLSSQALSAPIDNLDPILLKDLFLIEQYRSGSSNISESLLKANNLPVETDPVLRVFFHFKAFPSAKQITDLEDRGVVLYTYSWIPPVGAHPTGFMLALAKSSIIRTLVKDGSVERITAAYRQLEPLNDITASETGAATVREYDPPVTGEGVRVGVLDSGFNLDHDDLPEPFATMDYADYPDTSEDISDVASGHGSHVAGTVFGSGTLSNGKWMGMAPNVDPIYLKIGDDSTAGASSAAVVGAIRGAVMNWSADIITMSYGGWDAFHDGSSEEEQAVDWAVGEGTTVFMSAGNSRFAAEHYMNTVAADDTSELIQVIVKHVAEEAYSNYYLIWYQGVHLESVELSARIYDGEGELIDFHETDQVISPRGTGSRLYIPTDPFPQDSSSFFIDVINHSDRDQEFHIYAETSWWSFKFAHHVQSHTVGLPSTADSCISVGAYVSRGAWTDYHGEPHGALGSEGSIASFSSLGPRIDGLMKPDITAPGQRTISCRDANNYLLEGWLDTYIISSEGDSGLPADYIALQGTSMSSPAAAGTAALIVQMMDDYTPSLLRQRIFSSARTDEFTEEVPNNTWGWGKIDAVRALTAVYDSNPGVLRPEILSLEAVYPNPFNASFTARFRTSSAGLMSFTIYDLTGRRIWSTERNISNPGEHRLVITNELKNVPSGLYWFKVTDNSGFAVKQLALVK